MFCTSKEQETCEAEKRGCEGCYYKGISEEELLKKFNKEKKIPLTQLIRTFMRQGIQNFATVKIKDLKQLIFMYEQEKEKNKKLEEVIDMMAKDLVKVPTNDYMSETQREIARYMNRHLKEKKETIKQYYFKKAEDRS